MCKRYRQAGWLEGVAAAQCASVWRPVGHQHQQDHVLRGGGGRGGGGRGGGGDMELQWNMGGYDVVA